MTPFAPWAPDSSDFDPTVTDTVLNVIPRPTSYGPFPGFVAVSSALAAQPRGAFLARTSAGAYRTFAFTETDAYEYDGSTRDWDEVTKTAATYAVPSEGAWSVVQFGNYVIAVNGIDSNQYFDLGTSTLFDDLAGTPPKAAYAAVVGDFLTLGNTETYGTRSVAWSGVNDAEFWQPGRRGSDYQVFPEGGEVLGIAGFERGAVTFQDNVIREQTLNLGSPFIFTFNKTDETRTIVAPRSITRAGGQIFFLTLEGFFKYGVPSTPIGNERVDRFFQADADLEYLWQVQGAADPVNKIVYWRYKSNDHVSTTTTDRVLIYNYVLDRWSIANVELSWIFSSTTPAVTLEGLDALGYTLDTLPTSLDSRQFAGGTPLIGGFNASFQLGFFSGAPLEAVLQTGDVALGPSRAFVRGFRPLTDAETITGRIAFKDRHGGDRTWGPSTAVERTGLIPVRAAGRLHRFEVTIPAEETWDHAHGIDVEAAPEGQQ